MKKYIPIIFIIFIFILCMNNEPKTKSIFLEENTFYKIYNIKLNNINLSEYKYIFKTIPEKEYKIINFKFVNNYYKTLNDKINNIKIEGRNYLESLEEYIDKYLIILYDYDIESEISKIKNANMLISEIKIYTTNNIYNEIIKKMQKHQNLRYKPIALPNISTLSNIIGII